MRSAVRIMAEKGLYYNPTLQTGSDRYDQLRSKKEKEDNLTEAEESSLETLEYKFQKKYENLMTDEKNRCKNRGRFRCNRIR